jgi:hypothetical protein
MLDYELEKRKSHLAPFKAVYKRVFDILFNTIIDTTKDDLDTNVWAVRYSPNARFMQIGVGWKRDDSFPRSGGFFGLWRDGIFFTHEVQTYPKMKCLVDYRPINQMNDDEIVEAILDRIGAPFASRFPVPVETGAFRHETRRLVDCIKVIREVAPGHYQREVDDLMRRIGGFGQVVGA